MGRGKGKMELIEKQAPRLQTFKKRKEGLIKKLSQLTTLCGIRGAMIIHEPTLGDSFVWPPPENPDHELRSVIEIYNIKMATDPLGMKRYGVADFLAEQKNKKEAELEKLRKSNSEAKYPRSLDQYDCFKSMNEYQLRMFSDALRNKAMMVRSRIHEMKRMGEMQNLLRNSAAAYNNFNHNQHHQFMHYPNTDHMNMNMNVNVPRGYYIGGPSQPPPPLQANNPYVAGPSQPPPPPLQANNPYTSNVNMPAQAQAQQQHWAYANNMQTAYPFSIVMDDQKPVNYGGHHDNGVVVTPDDLAQYVFKQFNP